MEVHGIVRRPNPKRPWIIAALAVPVLAIVCLAAVPPMVMGGMLKPVSFPYTHEPGEFGLKAAKLRLKTEDGLRITAHEVAVGSPKAVVLFLSGIHRPSVTSFLGHSAMLRDHGYASVLCEMRAHGESEGKAISVGYKEPLDVKAAVGYIKSRARYKGVPVVVFGLSMGGAVAINSMGTVPGLDGLVSMSAFASWEDAFADNMAMMGAPGWLCSLEKPFVKAYCALRFGKAALTTSPKQMIGKLGDRPALLFHSRDDSQIPYANLGRILRNAPPHVETWVKKGDYHIPTDRFMHPLEDKEYARRILGFLESHFGGDKG